MIVRTTFVRGVPASAGAEAHATARARLSAHLRYLVFRPEHPTRARAPSPRPLFSREQDTMRRAAAADLLLAAGCVRVAYHLLVLAPGPDEPVLEARTWTRAVLADLGRHLGLALTYVGAAHAGPHAHVHVVLAGSGRRFDTAEQLPVVLRTPELTYLRQRGRDRSAYALLRGLRAPAPDRLLSAHLAPAHDHLLDVSARTLPLLLAEGHAWVH